MVVTSKTADSLKALGLNKYERNLWVALLSRSSSTVGELADLSNVPRSRCYDVLQSLADRGFVLIQPGKPMKYVAVNPSEAFDRAKKKVLKDANEMVERYDQIKNSGAAKELEKLHKESIKTVQPEDLTGSIKGKYAMLQQMESMFKKSKKSIKIMATANSLIDIAENHMSLIKKLSENGVSIKIAAPINKQTTEAAKSLSKHAQIRNIEESDQLTKLLGRMAIVDGSEFLMGLTDDTKVHPTQDVAFWSQSDHASSATIEPMFELVWNHAKPVKL
ncbi:MAG: TrmB family transcriptional regulator [Candidatus Aenigmarchaeota archaeon]|nr:TrmB family transcriptional regulator [Candidatus Aenigmarchaeota archaeon]